MNAITKAELAEELVQKLGINKREAKQAIDDFFGVIAGALIDNELVKISGFGRFDLHNKKGRPGRNPKTGVEIPISPRRVVTFRAGQKLRALVNNQTIDEQEEDFNDDSDEQYQG